MTPQAPLVIAILGASAIAASAYQTSKADLAFGLGFAVNAQAACENLMVNGETVRNATLGLGSDPREMSSPYNSQYGSGLDAAWNDAEVCTSAWLYYGCEGERISRLVMENPFGSPAATTCVLPELNWDD